MYAFPIGFPGPIDVWNLERETLAAVVIDDRQASLRPEGSHTFAYRRAGQVPALYSRVPRRDSSQRALESLLIS
jgi:hypothetical protein